MAMQHLTSSERNELLEKAKLIAETAHAPYSKFRVGAAVLGERGIHVGSNVENGSYGLGLCAERSALSAAIAAGDRQIRAIAIACIDAQPNGPAGSLMPCGACRQWIAELAPEATILIAGDEREYSIDDLLPQAFRLF
jgi:cytidine deaminase